MSEQRVSDIVVSQIIAICEKETVGDLEHDLVQAISYEDFAYDLRDARDRITELETDCKRLEAEIHRLEECRIQEQERLMELEAENARLRERLAGGLMFIKGKEPG